VFLNLFANGFERLRRRRPAVGELDQVEPNWLEKIGLISPISIENARSIPADLVLLEEVEVDVLLGPVECCFASVSKSAPACSSFRTLRRLRTRIPILAARRVLQMWDARTSPAS